MIPAHDREARRPAALGAGPATPANAEAVPDGGGNRARLSTGTLLAELGEHVARPAGPTGPARRRPLLPTAVARDPDGLPTEAARLLGTLASVDPEEPARSHALARYATAMAGALAPASAVSRIRQAALLCNIGLVAVPRTLLEQTAPLTPDELQLIRRHPILGAELLHGHAALADLILPVLHHHEDVNGGGYPYGLSGDWIPLSARIIRVAETFDALRRPRPYRPALAPREARAILQAGAGKEFDSHCITALAAYLAGEQA